MIFRTRIGFAVLGAALLAALIGWLLLAGRPTDMRGFTRPQVRTRSPGEQLDLAQMAPSPEVPRPAAPSETLALAVEAAAMGKPVGSYFAEPAAAGEFVKNFSNRLPSGKALVAQSDQVNAGAEAGHLVPVTVWVDGSGAVAALQGEARFAASPGGHRIAELRLARLPLKVASWDTAAAAANRDTPGLRRDTGAPFYGRFRFTDGTRYISVDALTGMVE